MLQIEALTPGEVAAQRLRNIRLRALRDAPDAFGSTLEDTLKRSPQDWLEQLKTLPLFLAVLDGDDAGMVRYGADDRRAGVVWLLSMWVAPAARGKGAGDALVEAVVNAARQGGAKQMLLDVADGNHHAIALYARHGFKPNGVRGALPPPREHIAEHQMQRSL